MKNGMINWVTVSILSWQLKHEITEFFKKLFGEKPSVESGDDDTIVIKVRNSGEPFFIEIDLERSDLTLKKLSQIIQKEFELSEGISFVTTKQPDVLIRNDKDVKRLKAGDEIELIQVDASH